MKQYTIVADDRVGLVADISYILGKAKVNIEAISVSVLGGKAVIILSVKDSKAKELLEKNEYQVLEQDLVVVKLKDEPGVLAQVSKRLSDAQVSINSIVQIARGRGSAVMALEVDKPKKAQAALADVLVSEPLDSGVVE